MITVGLILIALAIVKEYEPVLLLPIGFGCILANIPCGMSDGQDCSACSTEPGSAPSCSRC